LEAGAIDGARGILINISGSSSLKLSEVNIASTLIQSAAHEDANIIFGAVLDENMGDDIKITVIATGFRQDHFGRRQRSANDALVSHVSTSDRLSDRPRLPRFASEEAEEFSPLFEPRQVPEHPAVVASEKQAVKAVMEASPAPFVLHPQPQPILVEEAPARSAAPARVPVVHSSYDEPFEEEYARLLPSKPAEHEVVSSARAEGQQSANHTESEPQLENLDIPAFLRRPV
jgi:cell division protein FtsZ